MILGIVLAAAVSGNPCGELVHNEAGGDYTNPADRQRLAVVETFHFPPSVANLVRGASGTLGGDIGYTLEHFPNHVKALAAMAKLALRDKTLQPQGARYSVDCFFDRALRFSPKSASVRTLYGGYLLATARAEQALEQFSVAAELDPDNATTHYNLGLLYMKQRDFAKARQHAKLAYQLGFPLPGLRQQLSAAGQWEAPD